MFMDTVYYDEALEDARERGEASMAEIEDLLAGVPSELRIVEGRPRERWSIWREEDAREIVAGSRGFGAGRAVLGSVSHALLHESDRPLVILTRRAAERETRRAASRPAAGERDGGRLRRLRDRPSGSHAIARARGPITVVTAYDAPPASLVSPITAGL